MWIQPAINTDRTEYYEIVLCYVENVLVLLHARMRKIEGIKEILKLKGDKAVEPKMYLSASLQKVLTVGDTACWEMSLGKYVRAAVTNLEKRLSNMDHRIPF